MAEVRALVVEAKAPAADVMVVGAGAAKRELGGATALEDGARATVAVMVPDTQGTAEAARVGGTAVVAMVKATVVLTMAGVRETAMAAAASVAVRRAAETREAEVELEREEESNGSYGPLLCLSCRNEDVPCQDCTWSGLQELRKRLSSGPRG